MWIIIHRVWNSFYWYVGDGFRCSSALCLFSSCSYTICSTQIDLCPSQVAMYVYIAVFCICLQSCHKALWIYRFITLSVESVKFVSYQYLYVWFYREQNDKSISRDSSVGRAVDCRSFYKDIHRSLVRIRFARFVFSLTRGIPGVYPGRGGDVQLMLFWNRSH